MRWLSFYRNQKLTFGYITSDGSGVVDVGERSDFSDIRQVLESTDLASLAGKCGDSAVILGRCRIRANHHKPKNIVRRPKLQSTSERKLVEVVKDSPRYLWVRRRPGRSL